MNTYFTSESVSKGHPDKVADQIADAILYAYLLQDTEAHVACEVMVTNNHVIISGEITSTATVDIEDVVRHTIRDIGYVRSELGFCADSCQIEVFIQPQSPNIRDGICNEDPMEQGAGDQGSVFGYATIETSSYMPMSLDLAQNIMYELDKLRNEMNVNRHEYWLRPDAKCQVTVEYGEDEKPIAIDTIVVSMQHDEDVTNEQLRELIVQRVLPAIRYRLPEYACYLSDENIASKIKFLINPAGPFVVGGPVGDTGLTGRKIVVDTYGGRAAHGGGAFSGKDPSKVDRSAAYMARYIAKNLVAAGMANEMQVQLSYVIGQSQPVSVAVNTFGTGKASDALLADFIKKHFDLRPKAIAKTLHLFEPVLNYRLTATYGHFGNPAQYFTWENLDIVDELRQALTIRQEEYHHDNTDITCRRFRTALEDVAKLTQATSLGGLKKQTEGLFDFILNCIPYNRSKSLSDLREEMRKLKNSIYYTY